MADHPEGTKEKNPKKMNPKKAQSAAGRRLSKKASAFSKRGSGATYS